jgi:alpha-amylase/alpha-mannosidase (GH57 family)
MLLLVERSGVKVSFDVTPTLLEQIEMYVSGRLTDKYLQVSLKNADELTGAEKAFILERFFDISWGFKSRSIRGINAFWIGETPCFRQHPLRRSWATSASRTTATYRHCLTWLG